LHANTTVGPLARESLEKLCKYVCRPAMAAVIPAKAGTDGTGRCANHTDYAEERMGRRCPGGAAVARDLVIRRWPRFPTEKRKHPLSLMFCAERSRARTGRAAGAKPKSRRKKHALSAAEGSSEERDESTKMTWAECQKRAFLCDVLPCKVRRPAQGHRGRAGPQANRTVFCSTWSCGRTARTSWRSAGHPMVFAALDVESLDSWDDVEGSAAAGLGGVGLKRIEGAGWLGADISGWAGKFMST